MENLNMLKTEFSQRSNSDKREPELLKLWENTFEEVNKSNTCDVFANRCVSYLYLILLCF